MRRHSSRLAHIFLGRRLINAPMQMNQLKQGLCQVKIIPYLIKSLLSHNQFFGTLNHLCGSLRHATFFHLFPAPSSPRSSAQASALPAYIGFKVFRDVAPSPLKECQKQPLKARRLTAFQIQLGRCHRKSYPVSIPATFPAKSVPRDHFLKWGK